MNIHALTVCVDYWDFLEITFGSVMRHLMSWTIVTKPGQREQIPRMILNHPLVHLVETEVFTARGATFNKGAAMEEGRRTMLARGLWEDWILFIDADIMPVMNSFAWAEIAEDRGKLTRDTLYGAWRYQGTITEVSEIDQLADGMGRFKVSFDPERDRIKGDGVAVGYFQMFHSSDRAVRTRPGEDLLETHWLHAGNYDNGFMARWPRQRRKILEGVTLVHLGERDNWWGRGEKEKFDAMQAERKRRGGRWDHERIDRFS